MYAIVEIGGKQYRVTKDMQLKVPTLQADPGISVDFDRVLAFEDDKGNISFGTPLLNNTNVSAKIIEHGRDKKIIVFKKKRRKGYQKKNGHRQGYSLIEITEIGTAKKAKTKEAVAPIADKKAAKEKTVQDKKTVKPKTKAKPKIEKKTASQAAAQKTTEMKKTTAARSTATKKTSSRGVKKDKTESKSTKSKKATPKKDVKEE